MDTVPETKFLGLIIDNKLGWKLHINHVKVKTSKSIVILLKSQFIYFFIKPHREPANSLFFQSNTVKFEDLVNYYSVQIWTELLFCLK